MDMDKFRVCGITLEGCPQVERDDLTLDEAYIEMNRLKSFFPDVDFYIDVAPDDEAPMRRINTRDVADGWEDFFPDYE
jgi:hypothetical protein